MSSELKEIVENGVNTTGRKSTSTLEHDRISEEIGGTNGIRSRNAWNMRERKVPDDAVAHNDNIQGGDAR